jgi:hypothetical protein
MSCGTLLWSNAQANILPAKFDIVIDVNGNGLFDIGTDFLDANTIEGFQICLSSDQDGICDDEDNCPLNANGLKAGSCTKGNINEPCTIAGINTNECGNGGFCSMNQEDTYPSYGNGIGDACDCEGNFNCTVDQDVDGSDASIFKADFGRSGFNRPCITSDYCNGDFTCDGNVDGSDAAKFKSDFGRSSFQNSCPICVSSGPWCNY